MRLATQLETTKSDLVRDAVNRLLADPPPRPVPLLPAGKGGNAGDDRPVGRSWPSRGSSALFGCGITMDVAQWVYRLLRELEREE